MRSDVVALRMKKRKDGGLQSRVGYEKHTIVACAAKSIKLLILLNMANKGRYLSTRISESVCLRYREL